MGITINKAKVKPKTVIKAKAKVKPKAKAIPKMAEGLSFVRSIADKAGELDSLIRSKKLELSVIEKEYAELVAPVQGKIDNDFDASASTHASGKEYTCKISAKGSKTTLTDPMKAYEILEEVGGLKLLSSVLKFGVTDLKQNLTSQELDDVTKTEKTGARRIQFIKI